MKRLEHQPELLDGPLDPVLLRGTLCDLARVNRWLGGVALSRRALIGVLPKQKQQPAANRQALTLLDVGTGAADIPAALVEWFAERGVRIEAEALDERAEILDAAREMVGERGEIRLVRGEGTALPYPDGSFDVAHTSLVLHHLEPSDAIRLLQEMGRVARLAVIANDLDRTPLWWVGAWLLAHLFTRNPYTRHDAPLSVRRAYRPPELEDLALAAGLAPVALHRGFLRHRYALVLQPADAPDLPERPRIRERSVSESRT